MRIHECQAKRLFGDYRIPIAPSRPATTVEEAAAEDLGMPVVVKAEIHADGLGKASGVVDATTVGKVCEAADRLLGVLLIPHQTGPEGRVVQTLPVEKATEIASELYLSLVVNHARRQIVKRNRFVK